MFRKSNNNNNSGVINQETLEQFQELLEKSLKPIQDSINEQFSDIREDIQDLKTDLDTVKSYKRAVGGGVIPERSTFVADDAALITTRDSWRRERLYKK